MTQWLRRWLAILVVGSTGAVGAAAEKPIVFDRDIRPILSDKCYKCHGPDEKERQAGLRLDLPESATAMLESGVRAVVPGKRAESPWSPGSPMPIHPSGCRRPTAARPCRRPTSQCSRGGSTKARPGRSIGRWSLRCGPSPAVVKHEAQVRNPIDRFVLARLEADGLEPAPEADKITLVRRVTLDLTGLPPSPAEVDAFLADSAPDAYENWSSGCWLRPAMASTWPATGSTRSAMATRTGCISTTSGHCGNIAIGSSAPSTRNLPFDQFTDRTDGR